MRMNRYSSYLRLIRLMFNFGIPFEDRMSMKEFEAYEEKIKQSQDQAGG